MAFVPILVLVLSVVLAAVLWWISREDLDRFVIPNSGVVVVAGLGGLTSWLIIPDAVLSRVVWALGLLVLGYALSVGAEHLLGRPALGMGDVKLFAAAAMWIGPAAMGWLLSIASGSALAATLLGRRTGRIAFGPYLSGALFSLWCASLWQQVRG